MASPGIHSFVQFREAEKEVITQSDAGWLSDVQPV